MHIGFLTPEYVMPGRVDGGLANYLRKVSLELVARGQQVSALVLSAKDACWQDEGVVVYEVKRVTWPRRLNRIRYLRPFTPALSQILSSRRLAQRVWKIHSKSAFDVLQVPNYQAPGFALRHNSYIPVVCRISSYTPLWRSAYGRQRNFREFLSDWLEVRQVLDANAAFAPSHFLANIYARLEGYKPEVIRTPLDGSHISLDESYYQAHFQDETYLLFFGTLSRIKGVDLLAAVIPSVLSKYTDLEFVFIGRDDHLPDGQKVFDYIRANCSNYEHRLHYAAAMSKSQLYPIVAHARGVIMPSRVDNYPNACLESQSMGIPVIGTYESSLDEMIVEGVTGFLAKNNDPRSISQAIDRLLSLSSAQRQKMQDNVSASIQAISSEDRIGQLLAFYEKTIATFATAAT